MGCSPLTEVRTSLKVLVDLEARLVGEMAGPSGLILRIPNVGENSIPTLNRLHGQAVLFDSNVSTVTLPDPGSDYRPIRLGANPLQPLFALHRQALIHVLTASGIPAEFVEAGDGTARRKAWRQVVFGSIEAELTEKLKPPIKLDLSELRASDLASRSRADKQLIEAGMTNAQASIISGVD